MKKNIFGLTKKRRCMVRLQEIINFLIPIDAGYELIRLSNPNEDGGYLVPDDLV